MTQPSERTRIMLVDDDPDLVDILRMALEEHGYEVLSAADPATAMQLIERVQPDLLVLDVMIPDGTEGFHMVWQLRARPDAYFQHVPIIMLTAVHHRSPLRFYPDAADHTYAPGEFLAVEEFIDKPVDPAVLLQTVARVLQATRAHHGP